MQPFHLNPLGHSVGHQISVVSLGLRSAVALCVVAAALACSDRPNHGGSIEKGSGEAPAPMSMPADAGANPSKTTAPARAVDGASTRAVAGSSGAPVAVAGGSGSAAEAGSSAAPLGGMGGAPDSSSAGEDAPAVCSGCPQETTDKMDMSIHVHHMHLKSADPERSRRFYEQFFAAKRIKLNGVTDALLTVPVMLLFEASKTTPLSSLPTALQHVGFGASDPGVWYDEAHEQGVAPDTRGYTMFNTNETPTIGEPGSGALIATLLGMDASSCIPPVDRFSYMYVLGPDNERIEVLTGVEKRFNHVHFTSPDVPALAAWYTDFLGLTMNVTSGLTYLGFELDDIGFFFETIGERTDYEPSDDYVWSHIAFSVTYLSAWLSRARAQNIEVVAEPAPAHGFTSFFVRGPDGVLIELVQAVASQELCHHMN